MRILASADVWDEAVDTSCYTCRDVTLEMQSACNQGDMSRSTRGKVTLVETFELNANS